MPATISLQSPTGFPSKIDLQSKDCISGKSFKELYFQAVAKHVPFLIVTIVEVSQSGKAYYRLCDGIQFRNMNENKSDSFGPISRTYSFAIPCFNIINSSLTKLDRLKSISINSILDKIPEQQQQQFFDGVNHWVEKEQNLNLIGDIQYLIGRQLGKQGDPEQELLWTLCAKAHHSISAKYFLERKAYK